MNQAPVSLSIRLAESAEICENGIQRVVKWKDDRDLSELAERSIHLLFVLKHADLYSVRFR